MKHTSFRIALLIGSLYAATFAGGATENHPSAEKKNAPNVAAAKKAIKLQTMCPVMDGKINKDLYVDHDGKRTYLCCKGCTAAVQKEPQKYIKKLEADGITVAKLQTICPVMDEAIDKQFYVDHKGQRVYFCCPTCIKAFKADPEKYLKKMKAEGVALEKVPSPTPAKPTADKHADHQH